MPANGERQRGRPAAWVLGAAAAAAVCMLVLVSCRSAVTRTAAGGNRPSEPPESAPLDVREVRRALTGSEAEAYVGDAACSKCHPDAYRSHASSRHALTMRPVTVRDDGAFFASQNVVRDPLTGMGLRARREGDRCLIEISDGKTVDQRRAAYVLGTGRNALTYLSQEGPDQFTKLRLSYYGGKRKWDLTPQGEKVHGPAGVPESGDNLDGCVLCHVTVLRRDAAGPDFAQSLLGVGCERCHGPGKPHVDRVWRDGKDPQIERLAKATPARLNEICGACHRTASNAKPSDPHTKQQMARFQGVALELSKCFQKSHQHPNTPTPQHPNTSTPQHPNTSKTLSCSTCHAPHDNAVPGTAYYDRICMSCHQNTASQTVCRVNPRSGCTACHMPSQMIQGIPHAHYRNHWIKVWRSGASPAHAEARDGTKKKGG